MNDLTIYNFTVGGALDRASMGHGINLPLGPVGTYPCRDATNGCMYPPSGSSPAGSSMRSIGIFSTSLTRVSKSRIKRLRGLASPQYRLRLDKIRVFYDVEGSEVYVLVVIPKSESAAWLDDYGEPS